MGFDLTLQKRIAADVMKSSPKRIRFDPARLNDIKAAITKEDIRQLVADGLITDVPVRGVSRARARHHASQRSKGLRKGSGSKEGTASARNPSKSMWMQKIRAQRDFLKELKDKEIVTNQTYRNLYLKAKGGFFRNVRHIKVFINERGLATREAKVSNK